jgi:hypothetical protein
MKKLRGWIITSNEMILDNTFFVGKWHFLTFNEYLSNLELISQLPTQYRLL